MDNHWLFCIWCSYQSEMQQSSCPEFGWMCQPNYQYHANWDLHMWQGLVQRWIQGDWDLGARCKLKCFGCGRLLVFIVLADMSKLLGGIENLLTMELQCINKRKYVCSVIHHRLSCFANQWHPVQVLWSPSTQILFSWPQLPQSPLHTRCHGIWWDKLTDCHHHTWPCSGNKIKCNAFSHSAASRISWTFSWPFSFKLSTILLGECSWLLNEYESFNLETKTVTNYYRALCTSSSCAALQVFLIPFWNKISK